MSAPAPTEPKSSEVKAPETSKPPEGKAPEAPFVPLTQADFKVPEGLILDEKLGKEFLDVMNDQKLDRKGLVQKLVDLQAKAVNSASEAGSQEYAKLQEQWRGEVMKDTEIGGQAWPQTQATIGRALDTFGSEEAKQAFDATGAGNNPAIIKFITKLSKAAGVDPSKPIPGRPAGGSERTHAERLYPNQPAG